MTQSRFFQISLSFPILLWCLGLFIFTFIYKDSNDVIFPNLLKGYRVLIPYVLFAGLIWQRVNNRPYRMLILTAWVAPIVWGVFFGIFYFAVSYAVEKVLYDWFIYLIMMFWAAFVAYLMEVIPFTILVIFKNDFRTAAESGMARTEAAS